MRRLVRFWKALHRALVTFVFWLVARKHLGHYGIHECAVCSMPGHKVDAPRLPLDLNCCPLCKAPMCEQCFDPWERRCNPCLYGADG